MSMISDLHAEDVLSRLREPMTRAGYYVDTEGRIRSSPRGLELDSPWIHTNPDPMRFCRWYHVVHTAFNFIPRACLQCWKVVARPRTLRDLLTLYRAQEAWGWPSKCGVERREYVFGNYGGYFYTDSREQGEERLEKVRSLLSGLMPVYLKRYCTEFELAYGDSLHYRRPPGARKIEEALEPLLALDPEAVAQTEAVKRSVIMGWARFAWDRGDETVYDLTDGEDLYKTPRTYEPAGAQDKKED